MTNLDRLFLEDEGFRNVVTSVAIGMGHYSHDVDVTTSEWLMEGDESERLRKTIEIQAGSFLKMERRISELEAEGCSCPKVVESCDDGFSWAVDMEGLRYTRLPDGVEWPREDGRPIGFDRIKCALFLDKCCWVTWEDGTQTKFPYGGAR
jgi:hypothetical protein